MGLLSPTAFFAKARPPEEEQPQCGKCQLFKHCNRPKFTAAGRNRVPIMFVGDYPSTEDDHTGRLFYSKAGKMLASIVERHGVKWRDCVRTTALKCAPGDTAVGTKHTDACRPLLYREIQKYRPKVIVLMGHAACKTMISGIRTKSVGALERWVGFKIPNRQYDVWVCPTYTPEYVLKKKNPLLTRLFEDQIVAALDLVEGGRSASKVAIDVDSLKSQVECMTDPVAILKRLRSLARTRRKRRLAFDYEQNCIKPDDFRARIYSVSWCLNGKDTFAHMVTDEMLEPMSKILRNPKLLKIAANLKNEERWTIAKLGHGVTNWFWDTMQGAHVLDNRPGITSLKFDCFVRWGLADYEGVAHEYLTTTDPKNPPFNKIDQCPVEDLLLYNGFDSLLEYRLCSAQRKEMGFGR